MLPLRSVSVILPVLDETWSLVETVHVLVEENGHQLRELLIVTSPRTTRESRRAIQEIADQNGHLTVVVEQSRPYLGGAIRDAFDQVSGDYTVLMASDLETDPHTVKDLIARMGAGDADLIVASRWRDGGAFQNYGRFKTVANGLFQRLLSLLYGARLSDMTFGFRIYKTSLVRQIHWQETRHGFLLEALVKPLRLGHRIAEIPTSWTARREGVSHNMRRTYFRYLWVGLRVRLARRSSLMVAPGPEVS